MRQMGRGNSDHCPSDGEDRRSGGSCVAHELLNDMRMKKRVIFLLACLCFWASSLLAQDVPVGVVVAFKKGNSQELNRFLGEKVDLTIQDRTTTADRNAAGAEITAFFSQNKVNSFNVKHQGKRDESSFFVGTLTTVNGSFRVNCFFKRIQNKYFIHQIRIDKTDE